MKKCKNGHYYEDHFDACPYCPAGEEETISEEKTKLADETNNDKTQVFPGETADNSEDETKVFNGGNNNTNDKTKEFSKDTDKTSIFGNEKNFDMNATYIGDVTKVSPDGTKKKEYRATRKLVGWLVSYTIDKMGIDFRLYEGRNIIGKSPEADITIPGDPGVSNNHAVLLFRQGKYKIKDELSSNGTFVNGEDTEEEIVILKDGDDVKIGKTVLKFRSALG
ncbi:MAG: FHA domain-containing protein [Bacteroidota bacterium]|nr:FHA domain-containing protein [Bacteroidota bacterium]